ncbi:hypothetical protein BGX24_004960 [Mortierella sp. AD032]|nr:hypothetical protein BGX24_004960 [Mortierella sp. AD032]
MKDKSRNSDNMSEDDSEKKYRKLSKELSSYIPELRQMLEDDLRTYLNAENTREQEVLREFKEVVGRYFNDLNGSVRAILLAITESMVIFEEGCSELYADELEMLEIHQVRLQDAISKCNTANDKLIALGTKIGVQISEYEKEKSKFEIVKPNSTKIFEGVEYFVKRLLVIHNVGLCIREELLIVSETLGRLKENVAMLSQVVQADKIKSIAWKAKRISALCNEMYAFKSRVEPEFIPLLIAYSEDNYNKAYDITTGTRLIT